MCLAEPNFEMYLENRMDAYSSWLFQGESSLLIKLSNVMNTTVGVYDTHEKTIEVIKELSRAGFPVQKVSLIGKAVLINDLMYVKNNRWIKNASVIIRAILGSILGILTGMKLFAIHGLGFLFGASALLGALAGGLPLE